MPDPLNFASLLDGQNEAAPDETTQRILEAAFGEFLSFGLRKATMDDITRRAKVGRMTLHRRYPTKHSLIEAVFLQQIGIILLGAATVMNQQQGAAMRIASGLATGIHAMTTHPLFHRLFETDPEAILPYLTTQARPLLQISSRFVAEIIGNDLSALQKAETIIRICHSILLLRNGSFDLNDPDALQAFILQATMTAIGD